MSILTDLLSHKITFSQAVAEGEQWAANLVKNNPAATAFAGAALSDLKQAASNAVDLADKALGPIVHAGSIAVQTAANAAIISAVGPAGAALTPAVDSAIDNITAALKAEIDAAALQAKAAMAPAPAAAQPAGNAQGAA